MNLSRLITFSDGVMAIIITITVLGVRVPHSNDVTALASVIPVFLIYAFSFQTIGTFWNNHHHLMHATKEVSVGIMWTNLHLLFWLSLIPFSTEWLGTNFNTAVPTAVYSFVLLMSGFAYNLLQKAIVAKEGNDSALAKTLGSNVKGYFSLALYVFAIMGAFWNPWISYVLIVSVAAMWFIPDRRVHTAIQQSRATK